MDKPLPFTKEQIAQANQVDLMALVQSQGYYLENGGRRAFHAKQSGGLYLFKNSNKYYQFSTDTRGGPIDFMMQFGRMNFKEAVAYLLGNGLQSHSADFTAPKVRGKLLLPDKSPNYRRVAWYLIHIRGIEPEIVSHLMHEKKLYQQDKTGNCVFVAYDDHGNARYCSLRGTHPERSFKQDREDSDKSFPFHITGSNRRVFVCESPIDAMSKASLTKLNGQEWTTDHHISLGCLSNQALERFLSLYEIEEIVFCLDNDEYATYQNGSPAPNWGQEAAFSFAKKYSALGYVASVETPRKKDFNEELKALRLAIVKDDATSPEKENGYER